MLLRTGASILKKLREEFLSFLILPMALASSVGLVIKHTGMISTLSLKVSAVHKLKKY